MTTVEVTCKDKSYSWLLQWIASKGAKDTQHLRWEIMLIITPYFVKFFKLFVIYFNTILNKVLAGFQAELQNWGRRGWGVIVGRNKIM